MPDYGPLFVGPRGPSRYDGEILCDWRDCTDAEFFEALRECAPRLKRAGRLRRTDPEAARALVVEHFLRRARPRWAFDFRRRRARVLPSRNFFFGEAVDLLKARRSLKYRFYDYNVSGNYHALTPEVDWDRAGVWRFGAGWLTMSFGYWALFPAAGYAVTRDRRYARVFARCWARWFRDFPTRATDTGLEGFFQFDTLTRAGMETCMCTGRRALVMIDVLYSGMLGAVDADLAFEVVKYLWFVARLFQRAFAARGRRPDFDVGNHNLFDRGTVPFCLGTMFPEFDCAAELRRRGRAVLRRHASDPTRGAIRPDGTSWEHSARYAWYAAGMIRQALEVARLNRQPLFSAGEERRVAAFLETFADLTAPDGQMVPYGDCQPPRAGCHLELARSCYSGTRAERVARGLGHVTYVHAPARRRSPLRHRGMPEASRFFPGSGILVARTGWRNRDSLLFVTAEPRASYSGHSHHDFGSVQLWCDGVPLFYEAATWSYRIDEPVPAERGYYYSAFSHNLLTVEGYRPRSVFRKMGTSWWGDKHNPPVKTEAVDLDGPRGEMTVSHAAYPGITVRRVYRFDLAERWLEFTDLVTAARRARRTFRQWLHLGFGARARILRRGGMVVRLDGVEARCAWSSSLPPLTLDLEPSREVFRAARVFGLGRPLRLCAEKTSASRYLEISCLIRWRRRRAGVRG
jgi:hypothetical protein